jgi:hypothetical protein
MVLLMELDNGTAAFVACQCEPEGGMNSVTMAHANEEDFNQVLHNLGFNHVTICSSLGDLASTPLELERKLPLVIPRQPH